MEQDHGKSFPVAMELFISDRLGNAGHGFPRGSADMGHVYHHGDGVCVATLSAGFDSAIYYRYSGIPADFAHR